MLCSKGRAGSSPALGTNLRLPTCGDVVRRFLTEQGPICLRVTLASGAEGRSNDRIHQVVQKVVGDSLAGRVEQV
jgi:hypothetical protein